MSLTETITKMIKGNLTSDSSDDILIANSDAGSFTMNSDDSFTSIVTTDSTSSPYAITWPYGVSSNSSGQACRGPFITTAVSSPTVPSELLKFRRGHLSSMMDTLGEDELFFDIDTKRFYFRDGDDLYKIPLIKVNKKTLTDEEELDAQKKEQLLQKDVNKYFESDC